MILVLLLPVVVAVTFRIHPFPSRRGPPSFCILGSWRGNSNVGRSSH